MDAFKCRMHNMFGIAIIDEGSYKGFIKTSHYVIYIPILSEDKTIINLKYDNCKRIDVRTFADVRKWLRADGIKRPDYYNDLFLAMGNDQIDFPCHKDK